MRYCDTEKGRSMIETIGYMGVFMVLIAGIGRLVSNAFDDYKYSKASLQLGDLAATITRAAAVDGDYEDVVKAWSSYVPKTFRKKSGKYYHAFNGEVSVACAMPADGGCSKFKITYSNLNKKQCVELAMKDWSKNKTVSIDAIQVGTGTGNIWCWRDCNHTFPIQRDLVEGVDATENAACGLDSAADSPKQIIWTFN